jgi:hypothetical protein
MSDSDKIEAARRYRSASKALFDELLRAPTCLLHTAMIDSYERAALELDRLLAGGLCGPSDAELYRRMAKMENPS